MKVYSVTFLAFIIFIDDADDYFQGISPISQPDMLKLSDSPPRESVTHDLKPGIDTPASPSFILGNSFKHSDDLSSSSMVEADYITFTESLCDYKDKSESRFSGAAFEGSHSTVALNELSLIHI